LARHPPAVREAAGWWNAFGSVIRGLDDAAKLENISMLHFAARIHLDLVDLLEGDLKPKR
jgi:hypothetical protein